MIKKYKDQLQAKNNVQTTPEASSASYENDTQMETEQAMKEKRAKMAAQRREQLLAQMAKAQKSFITSNAEHFKDEYEKPEDESTMEWQASVEEQKTLACIGNDRKTVHNEAEAATCILCSEEFSNSKSCMVYPAYIQKSNVLGYHPLLKKDTDVNPDTDVRASPYVNSCGHEMHVDCWQAYYNNEVTKESRRPFRARNPSIFNIDKKQFVCPLCRFLSNAVLPAIPPLTSFNDNKAKMVTDELNFDLWYQLMTNYINSIQFVSNDLSILTKGSVVREELQRNYQDCVVGFLKEHCGYIDEKRDAESSLNLHGEVNKFSKEFFAAVKKNSPTSGEIDDLDLYTFAFSTCSYTIEVLEMYMRATDKPLSEMSVRYEKCVKSLIRMCGYYGRMNHELLKDKESVSLSFSYYALLICARDIYDTFFGRKPDNSVLQWDVFSMMVSMLFITRPVLFPHDSQFLITRGDSLDHTIFNTMFAVNLVKILLTARPDEQDDMDYDDEVPPVNAEISQAENNMLMIYEKYNVYRKEGATEDRQKLSRQLKQELKDQSRAFLRCSSILFHFLTEVPLPDEMTQNGGDSYEVMASYLNVNSDMMTYFNDSPMLEFLEQTAQHTGVTSYRNKLRLDEKELPVILPVNPPVRKLVELPEDYSDLMNSVSLFTCCNNVREDSRNPTMCLVCGEILCSQTYCCQREINKQAVGACNYHTEVCGAGAGIFLRIRDAEILWLGQNTGAFTSAPYLDDYGETDQGLRRGNPLHLCHESYKKLQLLWLSHSIHQEIAIKTESQSHIFQMQWNHL